MKKSLAIFTLLCLANTLFAQTDTASYYATRMIEFTPAPGQFMSEEWAKPNVDYALGENGIGVSLGGFGGYIILGFDRPIVNHPQNPYGVDFLVNGNAFAGSSYGVWSEPAAVQVMKDINGNGIPDDGEWYELAGSDYYLNTTLHNVTMTYYNPKYDSRATIPWTINNKVQGAMITNQFHEHSFYPADAGFPCNYDSISYTGNLITGCLNLSKPSYVEGHRSQLFGYADNRGFKNMDIENVANPYDYSIHAQDGFDLDWAVDANGEHVDLDMVHFVRIYTAVNQDAGWLGEVSSEILGVGIVKQNPNYTPRDYYNNYIGLNRLKTVVGQPFQYEGILFKNGRPINEGTARWWLSTDSVGTISNTGVFSPTHEGEAMVYFQQCDTVAPDSCEIIVTTLNGVVLEMEGNSNLSTEETSCFVGERIFITAQSTDNSENNRYQYDTYTWTTTHPEIGTIHNGLFTALQVGETMLYAHSNTNPTLYDSIRVHVLPDARLALKINPYTIPYYAPTTGNIHKTELLALQGTSSTISTMIDSVEVLTEGLMLSVEGNNLAYQVSEYGDYMVRIYAHIPLFANSDTVFDCTIHYGPDNIATAEMDVYIHDNQLIGRFADATTQVIYPLQNGEHLLAVDGAYAYVASANTLTRINLTTGKAVATVNTSVVAFLVKANMVLVRGKEAIALFHKTDLTPVKTFSLANPIINIETLSTATAEATYCINTTTIAMQDTFHVPAIPNNEAPKFKTLENLQSATVYENSEIKTAINYSRASKLTDKEALGSVKLYIRDLHKHQDVIAYKSGKYDLAGGTYYFVAGYNSLLDNDSVIYVDLEAIDEWGASIIAPQVKLTVKPRIYGLYAIPQTEYAMPASQTELRIPLSEVFGMIKESKDVTYTTTITANSNEDAFSTYLQDDEVVITRHDGNNATTVIDLCYTAQYKTSVTKQVENKLVITTVIATDVEQTLLPASTTKFIHNQRLYILRDGKYYDILGNKLQ